MSQPPSPEITLRTALPKDIPSIASLGAKTFSDSFGYSMPAADLQAYLLSAYSHSSIAAELSNPSISIIVACMSPSPSDEEAVVGFVYLTRGTTEACLSGFENVVELQRLYVSQDFHGKGVGRRLMEKVEEMARSEGYVTMWLGVWEENFKAQKVYERMGFRKVGTHDFVMGDCVQTDWILIKRL